MTELLRSAARDGSHPFKSKYDSVVRINDLFNPEAIDFACMSGVWQIASVAEESCSDAERYCFAATHLYMHDRKKSAATLAAELGCAARTVQSFIESAKKLIRENLKAQNSDYIQHPVLRVRVLPLNDGENNGLPLATIAQDDSVSAYLGRMSSVLFDAETHFAVTSYYLATPDTRLTASQISEALGLSESGVRQKLNEARKALEAASKYQAHASPLLKHPMFTREDAYHTQRRLSSHRDDRYLDLSTASARKIFTVASEKIELRYLIPLMRTHFYDATSKQPLHVIAQDMRLAVSAVEEYIVQGRDKLVGILREEEPLLAAHPILRSHRRHQTEAEMSRDYSSLEAWRDKLLTSDERRNLEWGSILFNRTQYHLFGWGMLQPERGLKGAFVAHPNLSSWVTYCALSQLVRASKGMCEQAQRIEDELAGRKVSLVRELKAS